MNFPLRSCFILPGVFFLHLGNLYTLFSEYSDMQRNDQIFKEYSSTKYLSLSNKSDFVPIKAVLSHRYIFTKLYYN